MGRNFGKRIEKFMRIKLNDNYFEIKKPWPKGVAFSLVQSFPNVKNSTHGILCATVPYQFKNTTNFVVKTELCEDSESSDNFTEAEDELWHNYSNITKCKHEKFEQVKNGRDSLANYACKNCRFVSQYHGLTPLLFNSMKLCKTCSSDAFNSIFVYDYLWSEFESRSGREMEKLVETVLSCALLFKVNDFENGLIPQEIVQISRDVNSATPTSNIAKIVKFSESICVLKKLGVDLENYSDETIETALEVHKNVVGFSFKKDEFYKKHKYSITMVKKELLYVLSSVKILLDHRIKKREKLSHQCVVCGRTAELTKHHVVPYQYRKFFPIEIKGKNHFDILLLCNEHHATYEEHALTLKNDLCERYDVCREGEEMALDLSKLQAVKAAAALLKHADKIPPERTEFLRKKILDWDRDFVFCESNLKAIVGARVWEIVQQKHARVLLEKFDSLDSFILMWRRHFIDKMDPKFLPEDWARFCAV